MCPPYPLYVSDRNDRWRYVLGCPGKRPLFVIGVNPHAASQTVSDLTARRVEHIARSKGYDGFVLLNLYPVRSKVVAALPKHPNRLALAGNRKAIVDAVGQYTAPTIWAAWGTDVEKRAFLRPEACRLIASLAAFNPTWLHFGALTLGGHPRHPSRAAYAWQFAPFNAANY